MSVGRPAAPPDVWRLLAHDLRWRLVTSLARTDQRVNELVEKLGEPQNLISYHLRLLRQSRLVSERRSSADGRDIYYHLNLGQLALKLGGAAAALHPSLGSRVSPQSAKGGAVIRPARVLFICTGNSARSQIAEAVLREQSHGEVEVQSAGPAPAGVHPLALEVLSELGIRTSHLRSKGLEEVAQIHFDLVISLCDIAREECPPLAGKPEYVHWSLPDPAAVSGSLDRRRTAFRSTANELIDRIGHLLHELAVAATPPEESLVGGKTDA